MKYFSDQGFVPLDYGRGLILILAIMVYLSTLLMGGGLALHTAVKRWGQVLQGQASLTVYNEDSRKLPSQLEQIIATIAKAPEIETLGLIPEVEARALLEPWLGSESANPDLPVPVILSLSLKSNVASGDLHRLKADIEKTYPNARLNLHDTWRGKLRSWALAVEMTAVLLFALILAATAAIITITARNSFTAQRDVIACLNQLGAPDPMVINEFVQALKKPSLFGCFLGFVPACLTLLIIGGFSQRVGSGLLAQAHLTQVGWAILLIVPLFSYLFTLAVTSYTVDRALERQFA